MIDLLEQAHEKLLNEMKTNKSPITERLHVWLCQQDDKELLTAVLKEDRSIHEATEYCYAMGSKIAVTGVADVTGEMEQTWCKEYYMKSEVVKSDLMRLPAPKGEVKEIIKEVKVVEEKVVYQTPTMDQIADFLDQQKNDMKPKKQKVEAVTFDL